MSSSDKPSEKYSFDGSPLVLTSGSTAIDLKSAVAPPFTGAGAGSPEAAAIGIGAS